MRRYIILFFLILLCSVSCNRKANVSLSDNEEKSLVALGQLWGFLKYHHPAVAQGDYDWDAELIKLIPLIRESEDESQWKELLDNWLDSLPPVAENPNKKLPDLEIKYEPNYGELFNSEYFSPKTIDKIKFILDNAVVSANRYVNVDLKQYGQLFITNELSYRELLYPELSYRLLALFRYWNIINYFFPYKELCDQEWSTVLADMLPEFVYAENQEQYIFACMKLITKIDDSHAFLFPNLQEGLFKVPFETQFIEDRLVVTMFTGNDTSIKEKIEIGDIITAVNGESVDNIVKRMLPYTPASNYAVKQRGISSIILTGNTATVTITVQRDEKTFKVKVPRYDSRLLNIPDNMNPLPDKEGYTILDNNIGYVLPSSCKREEAREGTEKVLNGTKGVIIDYRCYPSSVVVSSFLPRLNLLEQDKFFPEIMTHTNVAYPGYFFVLKDIRPAIPSKNTYSSKVVVIVNEYTQSAAEEEVMYFQMASNVIVIGSTTAAADGRTVRFNLPGNIRTRITGIGVYYPDGSDTQRVGIRIDEIVKPTIAGIKAGRDELMERAVEIINENSKKVENSETAENNKQK